jgi:hypothetical protein
MAETPTHGPSSASGDTRALSAALSGPAFETKNSGSAMHAATRHVERWAPEAGANRVRSLRSLGFVDRLVAPWLEVAQRSASMRLFQQSKSEGTAERENASHVSWVFPRPWYQDELDWIAASREVAAQTAMQRQAAPTMLTTRGTYVAPAQRHQVALPAALYEHIAPSLSIARDSLPRGDLHQPRIHDAYSPLVPFAAVNAAQLMQRAVAPLIGNGDGGASKMMTPGLRGVLAAMFERSVAGRKPANETRSAAHAPELVTPPAPRRDDVPKLEAAQGLATHAFGSVAEDVSAQRTQIVELQRAARVVAEREHTQRTQAQLVGTATADRARDAAVASTQATATERARVEERIAQRMAERATATVSAGREQRLHDTSRDAAARDAQVAPVSSAAAVEVPDAHVAPRVPHEITAALANLSPALASMIATNLAHHPERAVQTIGALNEALRNAELIARTAASGRSFEETRGPRLVMPAGLGGLVATVDRNVAQTEQRAQGLPFVTEHAAPRTALPMIAPRPQLLASQAAPNHAPAASAMRMPAISWLAAPNTPAAQPRMSSPTAISATASASPAALQHVAWADRWLARFSGAREASLDLLTATSARPETRLQALADAAPGTVFVAPQHDESVDDSPVAVAQRAAEAPVYMPPVRRYDDDEATPDSELVAIAQSVARVREPARAQPAAISTAVRDSLADAVARTVPVAPNAGLSAQLASSPFATAFRHVFPIASAPTFDVRALFGEQLSAAYLAGMLSPAARETFVGAAIGQLPGFAQSAAATPFAPIHFDRQGGTAESLASAGARREIEWSPEYVAPVEPSAGAPSSEVGDEPNRTPQVTARAIESFSTMRSALLSWNVESIVTPQANAPAMAQAPATHELRIDAPSIAAMMMLSPAMAESSSQMFGGGTQMSRAMVASMSLPMVGDFAAERPGSYEPAGGGEAHVPSFAAPGMIANRAQAWSVAQERSSADLSFDFVTPELVLAARVYGLGPAEAAQAMRLAIAGPGQLAAMASTVNRTFVQALAIEAERRDAAVQAPQASQFTSSSAGSPTTASASPAHLTTIMATMPASTSTFGVERRTPRGAFMWPSATIAALGLTAAAPDGEQGMPVAALELLAAQSVAALGTYAALGVGFGRTGFAEPGDEAAASASTPMMTNLGSAPASLSSDAARLSNLAPAMPAMPAIASEAAEPSESDVIVAATSQVTTSRRAKFEAMYTALGHSAVARSWSPAARAARALALAGRGDESITAAERAQIAWSVLPLVSPSVGAAFGGGFIGGVAGSDDEVGAVRSTGSEAVRETQRRQLELVAEQLYGTESRPGLSSLSSRAGEALGSYVAPSGYQSSPRASASSSASSAGGSSSSREQGAVLRAPTAAPDYVRTGSVGGARSTGRFGGGEVEVPVWFESAARKMFENQSSNLGGDISLADLTLVQSAPSTHIAASERGMQSAAPTNPNPSSQDAHQSSGQQIDIEQVANDVYRHILVLMDGARARNGEPYL